jgi:hypothetical protein
MPAKPHYKMAAELSLVLHECAFDNMKIQLQPLVLWNLLIHYENLYEKYAIATSRIKNCIETLKVSITCHLLLLSLLVITSFWLVCMDSIGE